MRPTGHFRLVIARDKLHVAGSPLLRHAVALVYVALVALFLTAPVEVGSAYDAPLPMPDELASELWE